MRFFSAYYGDASLLILRQQAKQESQQNTDSITFEFGLEVFFLKLYNKSQVLRKIIEERRLRYKY